MHDRKRARVCGRERERERWERDRERESERERERERESERERERVRERERESKEGRGRERERENERHCETRFECNQEYTLQHTAAHCNTLQHTAAHCNTHQRSECKQEYTEKCPKIIHARSQRIVKRKRERGESADINHVWGGFDW